MGGDQELAAVAADNTSYTWLINVKKLADSLEEAHVDCLPPLLRALYLGEPTSKAEAGYIKCEQKYKREPLLLEAE